MSSDPARKAASEPSGAQDSGTHVLGGIDAAFLKAVKFNIQQKLLSPDLELPRISSLANRIMRIAADPNVDVDKVVELVQTDQFLAGRILRLINSAYFCTRQDVKSLRHAIVLLGLRSVGDLIFSASMKMTVFKCQRYETLMRSLWRHAVATGVATEVVAQMRGKGDEPGFMAGLLHDVGKPIILTAIVDAEEQIDPNQPVGPEAAAAMMDQLHGKVGSLLARKWRISKAIQDAITHHDRYDREAGPLTKFVYCGNKVAHHLGFGSEAETFVATHDPGFVDLNLTDPASVRDILTTVKAHASRMLQVY